MNMQCWDLVNLIALNNNTLSMKLTPINNSLVINLD